MTSRSPRAAAIATGTITALLAVAWVVPPLAAAVVWPILYLVPGWAVISWGAPRIGLAGRLGLSIVLSVAVSTHLVYWLSVLVGDYDRPVVFAATAILAVPIPLAAYLRRRPPAATRFRTARGALLVAAVAALVVGTTLSIGLWRPVAGGIVAGGSNWSDLGVHLSIAQSLNAGGNFPPDVPYFAGAPLVYHWFADFHAAITAEAAGLFSVAAMVVQSTAMAAALALIVYALTRALVPGRWSRRAAVIAALLAVFAGGMGYVRFIGDLTAGIGPPLALVANNSYDNIWYDAIGQVSWPYFRIPSVMGTGLLAHRATTVGLPIFGAAMLCLIAGLPLARQRAAGWRDRPPMIFLAGLVGAMLAPFHFFFFPVLALLALGWVVYAGRLSDRDAPHNAVLFLAPYALALPFALAPALQATGTGVARFVPGWPSAPWSDGLAAVVFFYATNLGVPFVLALAALLVPRLPRRGFLALWIVGLFAVPNVVQLSLIDFDMNKYFQAMWLAIAVAAGWLLRRWPVPAVALALLVSIPSPLLVAGWTATSSLQVASDDELAAAAWAATSTPPGSVFVTDGGLNSFTDAAGRLRLMTFPPYVANLGFDPNARVEQIREIYCAGDPARSAALMRELGATYLVDAGRPSPCEAPVDFTAAGELALAYENPSLRVWQLRE
jgi:hypothetical protein